MPNTKELFLCFFLLLAVIGLFKTEGIKSFAFFSVPHVQRCENRTQLDFIAEQCSQTDSQALYLRPKSASFYTWIPAVGFTQGGLRESHRNRRVGAIIYSFFPPPLFTTTRGGAVQTPVPVGWRELPGEPWCSICRRNPLRVGRSIWLHSCLFESHVSGRVQPRAPGSRFHVTACWSLLLVSLSSCLAVTACCILGKWEMCVECVGGMDRPAVRCPDLTLPAKPEVYRNILNNRSYLLTQNILKWPCITSQTLV